MRWTGRYELISLERRVLDRPLAEVRIVNMREALADEGPDVILSATLVGALAQRLARGEQALLLLNRRGFSTSVFCRQCGATLECPNCSISLTVHRPRHGAPRRALPLLQPLDGRAEGVHATARGRTWSTSGTAPSRSRPRCSACCRLHAWRGSIATHAAPRRDPGGARALRTRRAGRASSGRR